MYRHGFELPEFAMFPLLDIPSAVAALHDMFRAQLDVAAEFGFGFLLSGLDYRASPDWGAKLGYSATALADANIAAIAFLQEIADDYRDQIPNLLIGRSEEHTSELQSLMRISYAGFCLQTKTTDDHPHNIQINNSRVH